MIEHMLLFARNHLPKIYSFARLAQGKHPWAFANSSDVALPKGESSDLFSTR
jgi:hypothetical protein